MGNQQPITHLIDAWQTGDKDAFDSLINKIYPSVHEMARRKMRGEKPNHTLQATALAHEALLHLQRSEPNVSDSNHLQALIALAMRRVLVDHARASNRKKRGGSQLRVTFNEDQQFSEGQDLVDLLALDQLLTELSEFEPQGAEMLCCHLFGGMTYQRIATLHGVSESTVHQRLQLCRAWIRTRGL